MKSKNPERGYDTMTPKEVVKVFSEIKKDLLKVKKKINNNKIDV